MNLNHADRTSETWRKVREYAAERITELHVELEKTSKTPEQTNVLRGQIKALRLLLETEKQKQQAGQE